MGAHGSIAVDLTLDCKGLACPMPIVKTKKAMEQIQPGQVVEVQATDRGSLADMKGWANTTGHHYLGTREVGEVLYHYLRKANPVEVKEEAAFPHTISNDELLARMNQPSIAILDVREPAEYAFGHIPGAVSIPLGVLLERLSEWKPNEELYVICRSGTRSDLACRLLAENGFTQVKNVVPGMAEWTGPIEQA
ncbi:sulfurtransferase TusA family protein [Brevibacillus fluminis]|uniref:sulfurtransferase TusA family protein n=1 Tax=Brevibacillus fluminis TaxID=511487 RepID=UPI003F8B76C6